MSDEIKTGAAGSDNPGLVARMGSRVGRLTDRLKSVMAERDALKTETDRLKTETAALAQRADGSAAAKRVEELTAELRNHKHRQVFDRLARAKGVRPDGVEDLYRLSEYKPEGDVADEAILGQLIDEQKTKRGYLFGQAGGEQTPPTVPKPGPAAGGGTPPGTPPGKFVVSRKNLNDTVWMMKHQSDLQKAFADGTAHWTD